MWPSLVALIYFYWLGNSVFSWNVHLERFRYIYNIEFLDKKTITLYRQEKWKLNQFLSPLMYRYLPFYHFPWNIKRSLTGKIKYLCLNRKTCNKNLKYSTCANLTKLHWSIYLHNKFSFNGLDSYRVILLLFIY